MSDSFFSSLLGRDMAVDLGPANTLVYVRGRGIVLNEPSVVAVNIKDGRPLAVGLEGKRMIGRTPAHIVAIRPLKDGVIADFEITEKMLRYFIQRVHQRRWAKPRMVICVPAGVTGGEKRAGREEGCEGGGGELEEGVIHDVKKEYSLALGERTAEEIKIALGSAYPLEQEIYAEIRGRDLVSGLPKTVVVST